MLGPLILASVSLLSSCAASGQEVGDGEAAGRLEFFTASEREVRDGEAASRFGLFTKALAGCDPSGIAKPRHLNCIIERVLFSSAS